MGTLKAQNHDATVVTIPINTQLGLRGENTSNSSREGLGIGNPGDPSFTIQANHGHAVAQSFVRRLTPKECSRLQGFPDDFAKIPWKGKPAEQCPDGPQYKCYGNSMATPVMAWLGKRIQMVHDLIIAGKI
jgi:DNA (cytosine-5)-methyltransferase 1